MSNTVEEYFSNNPEGSVKSYTEFPWWLVKDLPWNVIARTNPKDSLFGFLRVYVTLDSLPEWKRIYLVDIKAMRVVDSAFMVMKNVKGVHLHGAEGNLSIEGEQSSNFLINEFITSWGSSNDVYENYMARLINLKVVCSKLERMLHTIERTCGIDDVLNELKENLSKYQDEVKSMVLEYPQEYISKWGSPRCINKLFVK